jgi:hypothetical protein
MENDFKVMREWIGPGVPFPAVQRRPDFRSSGPKRLMPQLQIKVPTISRWGRRTRCTTSGEVASDVLELTMSA